VRLRSLTRHLVTSSRLHNIDIGMIIVLKHIDLCINPKRLVITLLRTSTTHIKSHYIFILNLYSFLSFDCCKVQRTVLTSLTSILYNVKPKCTYDLPFWGWMWLWMSVKSLRRTPDTHRVWRTGRRQWSCECRNKKEREPSRRICQLCSWSMASSLMCDAASHRWHLA